MEDRDMDADSNDVTVVDEGSGSFSFDANSATQKDIESDFNTKARELYDKVSRKINENIEKSVKISAIQEHIDADANEEENMSPKEVDMFMPDENGATNELDQRSVHIGNLDYSTTAAEVEEHFKAVGKINRVTIGFNKKTQKPKGFCYIEFGDTESMNAALSYDNTLYKGRLLRVLPKRTNIPGSNIGVTGEDGSKRGGRGGGRGTHSFRGGRFTRAGRGRFTGGPVNLRGRSKRGRFSSRGSRARFNPYSRS